MPASPHPIIAAYQSHDDAQMIAHHKVHTRAIVADADEVHATDFTGQYAGLYVRSTRANYNLDTESVAAGDGVNVIIDGAGNHFIKATDLVTQAVIEYDDGDVVAGAITIGDAADIALINVTSAVNVNVPAQADRGGRALEIKAVGAAGFTPVLAGVETIDGNAAAGYEVTTQGGFLRLVPRTGGYVLIGSQL
jgi:hypothetical protein